MPQKVQDGKRALLGDTEDNLSELLREVTKELGGQKGLAQQLARHLQDGPNVNPYLQSRAFQSLVRIMDKVDARAGQAQVQILSDAELEEEVVKACVRFMVVMPDSMYGNLLTEIDRRRAELAVREEKARFAREDFAKRDSQVAPVISKSPFVE